MKNGELNSSIGNRSVRVPPLQMLFDAMNVLVSFIDRDLVYRACNSAYAEFLKLPRQDVVDRKVIDIIGCETFEQLLPYFRRALAGETVEYERWAEYPVTGRRFIRVLVKPFVDEDDGFVHGFMLVVTDLTEQRRNEERVAQSEHTLEQLFTDSPAAMSVVVGPDHVYQRTNSEFHRMTGLDHSIIGRQVRDVLPELGSQGIIQILDEVYRTGKAYVTSESPVILDRNGHPSQFYLDFTYQPIRDVEGQVAGIVAQSFDVTEKVLARQTIERAKAAVENERENFRNLFKQTPEMVCILNGPEHVFEFVNEAHIQVLGFDATGMSVREAQPESTEVHGILDDVYRTGITAELHEIAVTVGSSLRHFNLTYAARKDEHGEVNGVMILGTEVTGQVRVRQALEKMANFIETMPMPCFAINADWRITYWNPAAVRMVGLSKDKVLGQVLWEQFPGFENSSFGENFRKAQAERRALSFEAYYPRFGRWYKCWPFPFEDGVAVSILDITDQKAVAEELQSSRERYQALFDHSPIPKVLFSTETFRIHDVNLEAVKLYGYSKEEFLGLTVLDIRPPDEIPVFLDAMKTSRTLPRDQRRKLFRHRKKNGDLIEAEISTLDLKLNGEDIRIAAILDVTDRVASEIRQRELLESLQAAKDEAERANELKSAFLANMSHEIRTPLGAMMGFADLLRDPGLSSVERSSYIDIITRNGEQLSTVINDILDLSKVEAGHMSLEFDEMKPEDVASDVLALLQVKANEKDLRLEYVRDPSTPESIVSDAVRVRQILLNVVSNAIKFTPSGFVKIRSFGEIDSLGQTMLCYEVVDSGVGIPEKDRERVFEAFVQADGTLSRGFGGTGLGLALSRQLARNLGGDVSVPISEEGRGSTFLIALADLPSRRTVVGRKPVEANSSSDLNPGALEGVRILVVDDSADNRQLIHRFLAKYGASVAFAENGWQGYRMALVEPVDLILMDIQMPEMDGYTATQKLREAGYRKPIIALTAHAMTEVRAKCMNVGCTDYLPKPIHPKNLISVVARHVQS